MTLEYLDLFGHNCNCFISTWPVPFLAWKRDSRQDKKGGERRGIPCLKNNNKNGDLSCGLFCSDTSLYFHPNKPQRERERERKREGVGVGARVRPHK